MNRGSEFLADADLFAAILCLEYIYAEITSKREEFGMKTASDAKQ